jgi:hypothetical protein
MNSLSSNGNHRQRELDQEIDQYREAKETADDMTGEHLSETGLGR